MIGRLLFAATDERHTDHVKSLDYFINLGIPCYGNKDVCSIHKGCIELPKVLKVDGFKVHTFELVHDVQNNALVIDTDDGIRILYCTDTKRIPKKVKGSHYVIIECNNDQEDMIDNAMEDVFVNSKPENHQSLDECIRYLQALDKRNLQAIVLWHMSITNINEKKAVDTIKREVGFDNVVVADRGLEIEIQKSEF